ncbi:MAG: hypothetical protein ACI4EH_13080 [Oliverpabstia sp.]
MMDYQEAIEELQNNLNDKTAEETPEWAIVIAEKINSALEVLVEYQKLGTLEEVREAVEKQKEERPIKVLGTFGGEEYECKNCGSPVEYLNEYCRCCGQKLDWSEEEKT